MAQEYHRAESSIKRRFSGLQSISTVHDVFPLEYPTHIKAADAKTAIVALLEMGFYPRAHLRENCCTIF